MINISEFITCKRIKFAYKLIHSSEENWNITGKYWFKKLDDKYGTDYFLCQCSCLKHLHLEIIPKFYCDVITTYSYIDTILDENICGNINIRYRHTPLWFESFSKSDLKKVKDLWDVTNNSFKN